MKDLNLSYSHDVMTTIWRIQLIEFMLKIYISSTHDLIRNRLEGIIPYKFSGDDVRNAPLERLLTVFSKLNGNIELQKKLNRLKDGRNHLAHQGFILQFSEIHELLGLHGTVDTNVEKISQIKEETSECMRELLQEVRDVAAHYERALA